jgi:hypothetical protein
MLSFFEEAQRDRSLNVSATRITDLRGVICRRETPGRLTGKRHRIRGLSLWFSRLRKRERHGFLTSHSGAWMMTDAWMKVANRQYGKARSSVTAVANVSMYP